MDKKEILEKCRKENLLWDEGKIDARNKGRQWGVVGFIFLCVLVMTYNLLRGLDNQLPLAFFWDTSPARPLVSTEPGGSGSRL